MFACSVSFTRLLSKIGYFSLSSHKLIPFNQLDSLNLSHPLPLQDVYHDSVICVVTIQCSLVLSFHSSLCFGNSAYIYTQWETGGWFRWSQKRRYLAKRSDAQRHHQLADDDTERRNVLPNIFFSVINEALILQCLTVFQYGIQTDARVITGNTTEIKNRGRRPRFFISRLYFP